MKRNLKLKSILLILLVVATFISKAKTQKEIDANGNYKSDEVYESAPIYAKINSYVSVTYDSVRALNELNSPGAADAYPWISEDGLRLYFTKGLNGNQLMFASRANTDSLFSNPSIVSLSVTGNTSFWFSNDELDVYICTTNSLYFAHRASTSSAFNAPTIVSLTGAPAFNYIKGASLNQAQNELFLFTYFVSPPDGIVQFSRNSANSFSYVRTLHPPLGYTLTPAQLSKNDLSLVFGAYQNIVSPKLYQINRSTPLDTFDVSTLQQIQGINDSSYNNNQPSMSDSLTWIAFVRSNTNSWTANDLYLAHKGTVTAAFNDAKKNEAAQIFPNPFTQELTIKLPEINAATQVEIYSTLGTLVYSKQLMNQNETIDFTALSKGLYVVKLLENKRLIATQKISKN